jgi:hypothetical protein
MVAEGVDDVEGETRHALLDVDAIWPVHLRQPDRYNLEATTREKQEMNVDGAYLVPYHHWALDTSVFLNEHDRSCRDSPACLRVSTTRHSALVCTITN